MEVVNEDLYIATLSENKKFNVEMDVKNGRGYKNAEENAVDGSNEVGVIPIDAIFSPVRKTKIRVEDGGDKKLFGLWGKDKEKVEPGKEKDGQAGDVIEENALRVKKIGRAHV